MKISDKTLIKIQHLARWIIFTAGFTALRAYSQMLVSDPWQQLLIDHQSRLLSTWHKYESEVMVKTLQEVHKTNQYLDDIRKYEYEENKINGEPAKVKVNLSRDEWGLNIKDYDNIESETDKSLSGDPDKLKGEKFSKMYDKALESAIDGTGEITAQRRELLSELQAAVKRLSNADTNAEVQKINGEISAINAIINALRDEELAQFRAVRYVDEKGRADNAARHVETERTERKKWVKDLKDESDTRKKLFEEARKNPDDRTNPYAAVVKPVPRDDTDWSFKQKYLTTSLSEAFKNGYQFRDSFEKRKEWILKYLASRDDLTEEQKEKLLELLGFK